MGTMLWHIIWLSCVCSTWKLSILHTTLFIFIVVSGALPENLKPTSLCTKRSKMFLYPVLYKKKKKKAGMRREGIRDCWVVFITFSSVAWKNVTLGRLWSLILALSCGLKGDRTTDKNKEEMNFPLDSQGKTALRGGNPEGSRGKASVFWCQRDSAASSADPGISQGRCLVEKITKPRSRRKTLRGVSLTTKPTLDF